MTEASELYEAILVGDAPAAVELTEKALENQEDPQELINQSMIPAMDEVGRRFEAEEYFVPELLLAARAMKGSMKLLRPLLVESGAEPIGRVAIGTVKGDLHDIGKNLVASLLEGSGFDVIDLGTDVDPEAFVSAVREKGANLIGLSALLTVTMPSMKDTIEALEREGVRDGVKVMIGGAPVTPEYAAEISADGYADNANAAVAMARSLID